MTFFEWSEAMSLGEPLLDADHKCLIGLINRLHESLQDGTGSDVLDEIFDGLIAYIEFHFAREEKVIEACGYPGAKAHQEEHAEFTQHIYDLRDRRVRGIGPAITHESLHYLRNWLNHHILIQDMAYKPYLEHNPLGNEVAQAFGPGLADDVRAFSAGGHDKTGSHVTAATGTDQGAW
ncbi:MAG: hemerythrin family protein [Proteobacteria bacterium]|nr:hemerythrin family protein [Pseudomonadota bacterium]